ncbi:MAG: 4Fe-4S dicluster domain-containing protein, partial [Promethearchaeota archaeon]
MESKNQIVDKLKQILKESQVLTDLEDIYVYSFEKVYLNQNCPKPDIVVKVHSLKEENEVMELAKKENAVLIKRGEKFSSSIHKPSHPLILLDNLKIPKLENCYEKLTESERLITNLRKLHINEYGTYQNLVLAIQNLLFSGTLNKCQQCVTCSGYCTIAPSFKGVETWSSKGRMLIGRGIMNGELTLSKKIVDILYSCTKCGLCFVQCFQDLEFHDAILHLRHKLAEKKLVPEVFHTAAKNIFEHGDPSAIPVNRRLSWIRNVPKLNLRETADNLCWLGCTVSARTPKTAKAFIN